MSYSNSGLGRFGVGFIPYRPAPYTPPRFSPQALPTLRPLAGAQPIMAPPPADLGVGSVDGGGYSPGGGQSNNGFQSGFGPDGMTAVTPGSPLSNGQAQAIGTAVGFLTGVPGLGWGASAANNSINNQHTITNASHMAQMDTNPALNGTVGGVSIGSGGFGDTSGMDNGGFSIGPGGDAIGGSVEGFGGGLGMGSANLGSTESGDGGGGGGGK